MKVKNKDGRKVYESNGILKDFLINVMILLIGFVLGMTVALII